jgi:4a-hydroxytetrahydrobiopterin dehydratase
MSSPAKKHCVPCATGVAPILGKEVDTRLKILPGWRAENQRYLIKEFSFPDFQSALVFVNKVGQLAEEEGHHPDITLSWGKAVIKLYTHKINGLSENDFIMAELINNL